MPLLARLPVTLLLGSTLAAQSPRAAAPPPNVVLIVADDMGYGDLPTYGATDVRTPAIDRLISQGVRLTSFYSSPECTPTRAALLSGRYQQRVGGLETAIGIGGIGRYDEALRLSDQHELGLPPSYSVLPSALKARGYRTAIVGKWHLGYEPKFAPNRHGFDYAFGPTGAAIDYFHHGEPVPDSAPPNAKSETNLYRNGKPVTRKGYITDIFTNEATQWLRQQQAGKPFFLYLPYTTPHAPYQGPGDERDQPMRQSEWQKGTHATYVQMIEALDRGVDSVMRTLDAKSFTQNTLVIFISDNGATALGSVGGLNGRKGFTLEGGIRVPAAMRWPGHIAPASTSEQVGITMDLTTSILRVAGAAPRPDKPLDGVDIVKLIESGSAPQSRTLFWRIRREQNVRKAARDGDMKYVYESDGTGTPTERLFDLKTDVNEKRDLLAARPEEAARMRALLARWEEDVRPTRPELTSKGGR